MPTVTNRGTVTAGAASNATLTVTSASFTPAAGSLLVAIVRGYLQGNFQLAYTPTDTIGGTGGTAWVQGANAPRKNGTIESVDVTIWTRRVGTSPSAGTITSTRNGGTTYWSSVQQIVEVAGQDATNPTKLSATGTVASGTTLTLDFGAPIGTDSLVISAFHGAGVGTPLATIPSGFTVLDNDNFDTEQHASAYILANAAQTHQWATGAAAFPLDGCALEINASVLPPRPKQLWMPTRSASIF